LIRVVAESPDERTRPRGADVATVAELPVPAVVGIHLGAERLGQSAVPEQSAAVIDAGQ
jgi:hypothetical protein